MNIQNIQTWLVVEKERPNVVLESFRTKMAAETWIRNNKKNFYVDLIVLPNTKYLKTLKDLQLRR